MPRLPVVSGREAGKAFAKLDRGLLRKLIRHAGSTVLSSSRPRFDGTIMPPSIALQIARVGALTDE